MAIKLTLSATYLTEGDIIIAEIYFVDELNDSFVPNQVEQGTVTLFAGTNAVCAMDIDRRMGNSDGAIKAIFNHPTMFAGWQLKVDATLLDGTVLSSTVPVLQENTTADGPFVEQPLTTNPGFLSSERIKENL